MNEDIHIVVEQGEDTGKQLTIPVEGARVGRSSKNDIVLVDPLLSRYHCRLFFKEGGLWVADLGSANETLLDDEPVVEAPIYRGNRITIGNTVMLVRNDGRAPNAAAPLLSPVDLGFNGSDTPTAQSAKRIGIAPLITVLCVISLITIGIFMLKAIRRQPQIATPPPTIVEPVDRTLTIAYEKVEASPDNIFYYKLSITPDGKLSIIIDDLQNNRSVNRTKDVANALLEGLTETLEDSGFFELDSTYHGVSDLIEERDISITIGKDSHTVNVKNRVEPEIFKMVREKLENFGRVELGLWAIQFSTEKLLSLSNDAYLLGKQLDAEREIALGNLAEAIRSFREAEWYLETVEEKPDFYADMLASRSACEEALTKRYKEQNFLAERAIRLREWDSAATELRALLEIIPDREDERHSDARKQLIEVDARRESLK